MSEGEIEREEDATLRDLDVTTEDAESVRGGATDDDELDELQIQS